MKPQPNLKFITHGKEIPHREAPLSDKYRLLIDDCSETGNYALTSDRDKGIYNLRLLGLYEGAQNAAAASDEGTTTVIPVGRYIMVLRVEKDLMGMSMNFFDFKAFENLREINATDLNHEFSEQVVMEFELLRSRMISSYKESEHDLFEFAEAM